MAYYLQGFFCEKEGLIGAIILIASQVDWRGAREVEWGGLENRYGGNSIEGSNPSLSARGGKSKGSDLYNSDMPTMA